MILRTIAPTSREVEGTLEDVGIARARPLPHEAVASLQIQHCFSTGWPCISEQYFFSTVWETISSEGFPNPHQSTGRTYVPAFGAFEQTAWAFEAALGQPGSVDRAHPVIPGENPFHCDTGSAWTQASEICRPSRLQSHSRFRRRRV